MIYEYKCEACGQDSIDVCCEKNAGMKVRSWGKSFYIFESSDKKNAHCPKCGGIGGRLFSKPYIVGNTVVKEQL